MQAYYDVDKTGHLNFRTFCSRVMGESNDDATARPNQSEPQLPQTLQCVNGCQLTAACVFQGWTNRSVKTTHSADMDPRNFAKILLRNIREQFKDVWIGSRKPQDLFVSFDEAFP